MKSIFTVFVLSLSLAASAQAATTTHFACKTDRPLNDGKKHVIQFAVKNLGSRSYGILPLSSDGNGDTYVTSTPDNDDITMLNENYNLEQTSKYLELRGDGDGFILVYLHLYADRDFTRGYFKTDDRQDASLSQYVPVTCQLK